jgi:hypothetical protein
MSSKEEEHLLDVEDVSAPIETQKTFSEITEEEKPGLFRELECWGNREYQNIKKEKTFNRDHCFAFRDLGNTGELFALLLFPNSTGSASKGGCSFDNTELDCNKKKLFRREIKCCSLNGSKICKECKRKLPPFQEACFFCGGKRFTLKNDSRWGISAKSTLNDKNEIKEFILFASIFMEDGQYIKLFCFKVYTQNDYFMKYVENQDKKGKGNSCNFQPFSRDFHLSGPIMIFEMNLYKEKIDTKFFNLSNEEIVPIALQNWNTGSDINYSKEEKELFKGKDSIDYKENISNFSHKKKSFGKERGKILRN